MRISRDYVTLTVHVPKYFKKQIKQIAFDRETTPSAMLRDWLMNGKAIFSDDELKVKQRNELDTLKKLISEKDNIITNLKSKLELYMKSSEASEAILHIEQPIKNQLSFNTSIKNDKIQVNRNVAKKGIEFHVLNDYTLTTSEKFILDEYDYIWNRNLGYFYTFYEVSKWNDTLYLADCIGYDKICFIPQGLEDVITEKTLKKDLPKIYKILKSNTQNCKNSISCDTWKNKLNTFTHFFPEAVEEAKTEIINNKQKKSLNHL